MAVIKSCRRVVKKSHQESLSMTPGSLQCRETRNMVANLLRPYVEGVYSHHN